MFPKDIPIEAQKKILTALYQVCKVYGVKKTYSMLDLQTTATWPDYEDTSCYFQSGNNYTTNQPFAKLVKNLNLSIIEHDNFSFRDEYGTNTSLRMKNSSRYEFNIPDNHYLIPDLKMEIQSIYIYNGDKKK